MSELGMVPAINTNVPSSLLGDAIFAAHVRSEPRGSYVPWRDLFSAGLPAAGISGFPSLHVDEPRGAPFGSPLRLMFQAVTRIGGDGARPDPALLDQALSAEQALRAHTINAAYAAFEDGEKGSISPGKLADLVLLSDDPLSVPARSIPEIAVLFTMVGGQVVHCASRAAETCAGLDAEAPPTPPATPGASLVATGNLAVDAAVRASSALPEAPPENVVDGSPSHWNANALAPGWVELTLARPSTIRTIRLVVAQDPAGRSVHEVWVATDGGRLRRVRTFDGVTADGDVLTFRPREPMPAILRVRVVTTRLGDLFPAWREIEVIGQVD
jgi:hypothetical protein